MIGGKNNENRMSDANHGYVGMEFGKAKEVIDGTKNGDHTFVIKIIVAISGIDKIGKITGA